MHPPPNHPAGSRQAPGRADDAPAPASLRKGERALIASIRRAAAAHPATLLPSARRAAVRIGIGDDCAVLRTVPGHEIVITTDLFLEQVHFRRDWHQPEAAGHRCLARGISDLAAMGATPVAAFLSLSLPAELAGDWLNRFIRGLLALARLQGVVLAGGDTAQAPLPRQPQTSDRGPRTASTKPAEALFSADIVLVGSVAQGKALLRSGAQPGDRIYVTGELGGASAELDRLALDPLLYASVRRPQARVAHPHLFPQPRVGVGQALLGRASAAIDLSDGLSTDLAHLCAASHVAAEIEASLLPIHPLANAAASSNDRRPLARTPARTPALDRALHGGEDYELLFTAPPSRRIPRTIAGVPVHRIGRILPAQRGHPRIAILSADGTRKPLRNQGWEHFRPSLPPL